MSDQPGDAWGARPFIHPVEAPSRDSLMRSLRILVASQIHQVTLVDRIVPSPSPVLGARLLGLSRRIGRRARRWTPELRRTSVITEFARARERIAKARWSPTHEQRVTIYTANVTEYVPSVLSSEVLKGGGVSIMGAPGPRV